MIKKYKQYIKESMTTNVENLLNSINDKKTDFYAINLPNDKYSDKHIDFLYDDGEFNKQLFKENLKKGKMETTSEIESFLKKNIDMNFFFLYDRNEPVLGNPDYLILQYNTDEWKPVEIYSIKGSVKNFYDELTAKTIELTDDNEKYIYKTSNSGNNWELEGDETGKFKEILDNDEVKDLIKSGTKIKIIN